MPGLAGIVDFRERDLSQSLLKMLALLKSEEWHKTDSYNAPCVALGRVSLGAVDPPVQPVFSSQGRFCLFMQGEIYDWPDDQFQPGSSQSGRKPAGAAKRALALIEQRGIEAVAGLNGVFLVVLWDSFSRTLTLANDRFGRRPLYYFQGKESFFFGSEVKTLLACPEVEKEPNFPAVAEFLTLEFVTGDKTLFKRIKVMEPATIMVFGPERLTQKRYWLPHGPAEECSFYRDDPYEKGKHLLIQAVTRQLRNEDRVVLSLSGGLDSRLILAAAAEAGKTVPTYTFGTRNCEDEEIARTVSELLGCPHFFFELTPDYLVRWGEEGVWRTEGMNNCLNFAGIEIQPEIRKRWGIVLNGFGGNELWGGISPGLVKFLFMKNQNVLARSFFGKMCTAFSEEELAALLTLDVYAQVKDYLFENFAEILKRSADSSTLGQIYHFYRAEKNRRGVLMGLVVDEDQVEYRAPFFDYEMFDFLMSVPLKQKLLGGFKRRLLAEKFPKVAAVQYQRTGLPANAGLFAVFLKRLWNVGRRVMPGLQPSAGRHFVDSPGWLRRELKDYVVSTLLDPNASAREYLNMPYVRRVVEEHLTGKKENSSKIGVLLALEHWKRLFVDGEPKPFHRVTGR